MKKSKYFTGQSLGILFLIIQSVLFIGLILSQQIKKNTVEASKNIANLSDVEKLAELRTIFRVK